MEVEKYIIFTRPIGHRLYGGVANNEIDHNYYGTQIFCKVGPLLNVIHSGSGHVYIIALDLGGK